MDQDLIGMDIPSHTINKEEVGEGRRGRGQRRRNYHKYNHDQGYQAQNNNGWNKPTKKWNVSGGCCSDDVTTNWKGGRGKNNNNKPRIYKSPYNSEYFDSHCHLDWILFKSGFGLKDFPKFSQTHLTPNFGGCITNACAQDMIRSVSELINNTHLSYKNIYGTFGCHPHNAKEWNDTFKTKMIFALKTGKWDINQSNINNDIDNVNDKWMCLCGHNNDKKMYFVKNVPLNQIKNIWKILMF